MGIGQVLSTTMIAAMKKMMLVTMTMTVMLMMMVMKTMMARVRA